MSIFALIRPAALSLFLILASGMLTAEERIRILGIGNSFTDDATRFLPQIIQSNPEVRADIAVASIGGSPLALHVRLAEEHEADSDAGKNYRYRYNGALRNEAAALKAVLLDEPWDYITIQQVSHHSFKPETYVPYAAQLVAYIRRHAPDAEIVFHETWAHSIDSYRVQRWNLHPDEMYERLHAVYAQFAEDLGLRVIPVGTAFQNAKATPMWDYPPTTIDVDALVYPDDRDNLPDMSRSLHRVFYWRLDRATGTRRVGNDGFHANANGQYLGGLVWYAFFLGQDPREITFKPDSMSEAQAASLREIAAETAWISR